jgi:hypothetical protein
MPIYSKGIIVDPYTLTYKEKTYFAISKFTSAEVLEALSKDRDDSIRAWVARNNSCPANVSKELSKDPYIYTIYGVADNTSTPLDVLEELSKHEEYEVRNIVAANASTPREVLVALYDKHTEAVLANPNCPGILKVFK